MPSTPYLSFVATTRNDDHGGNLAHRMQVFVEALLGQCDHHDLDAELVLVEWNPPPDRTPLAQALTWPRSRRCTVRIVQVPAKLHARFDHAETIPLHQMIAKNVGIRRARGAFVAATNVDVVFSDDLVDALGNALTSDRFYRADRHDTAAEVPVGVDLAAQLAYCRTHVLRVHRRDSSHDRRTGAVSRIYRDPRRLRAAAALAPLSFLPVVGRRIAGARRSLHFFEACGHLHTNGCGDFTLMARGHWHALRGYWEFQGFPIHVDGLLCYAARFSGLTEHTFPDPACIYHVEHGHGSGYVAYASGDKWQRLDAIGVPRLTPEDYRSMVLDMRAGRRPLVANDQDWGLGGVDLPEWVPASR